MPCFKNRHWILPELKKNTTLVASWRQKSKKMLYIEPFALYHFLACKVRIMQVHLLFGNILGVRSRCSECRCCHFHYFHSLCCHFHGCYFLCCLYMCYRVFFLLVSIWIEFLDDLVPIRDCLRYEILIVQRIRSVSNRRF
jgi:hypothetical protein